MIRYVCMPMRLCLDASMSDLSLLSKASPLILDVLGPYKHTKNIGLSDGSLSGLLARISTSISYQFSSNIHDTTNATRTLAFQCAPAAMARHTWLTAAQNKHHHTFTLQIRICSKVIRTSRTQDHAESMLSVTRPSITTSTLGHMQSQVLEVQVSSAVRCCKAIWKSLKALHDIQCQSLSRRAIMSNLSYHYKELIWAATSTSIHILVQCIVILSYITYFTITPMVSNGQWSRTLAQAQHCLRQKKILI